MSILRAVLIAIAVVLGILILISLLDECGDDDDIDSGVVNTGSNNITEANSSSGSSNQNSTVRQDEPFDSCPSGVRCATGKGENYGYFEAGQPVAGWRIEYSKGPTVFTCYDPNPPRGGRVTDGVVNPRPEEVANLSRCR